MRKLIYVVSLALVFFACKEEVPKDYVTLSGTITNPNTDSLVVVKRKIFKTIKVNEDGTFSDTLKINTGHYTLLDGKESTSVFLKNGFDLYITLDTKQFDETVTYKGVGERENNYLAAKTLLRESVFKASLDKLNTEEFNAEIKVVKNDFENLLAAAKDVDTSFVSFQTKEINSLVNYISRNYEKKKYIATVLSKGNVSPKFVDYENIKGGTTSLDDLKGKYVYIDIWATWCGPCKKEIPFLKEIEKAYRGKNIEFVSISVDKPKDHDKWLKMVAENELGGIQLFADNSQASKFLIDYRVLGIPHFILIDPAGNIVSANAKRPSDENLIKLFDELKI